MNPVRVQQIGHEITRSWFMKPFQGLLFLAIFFIEDRRLKIEDRVKKYSRRFLFKAPSG